MDQDDDRLEAEQALAEFHARIPDAVRELVRLYVTTDDSLARQRLRGRLHTLLDYLDVDREAGHPAPRSPYGPLLVALAQAVLPVLMGQAMRLTVVPAPPQETTPPASPPAPPAGTPPASPPELPAGTRPGDEIVRFFDEIVRKRKPEDH